MYVVALNTLLLTKTFIYLILFNPYKDPEGWVELVSRFYLSYIIEEGSKVREDPCSQMVRKQCRDLALVELVVPPPQQPQVGSPPLLSSLSPTVQLCTLHFVWDWPHPQLWGWALIGWSQPDLCVLNQYSDWFSFTQSKVKDCSKLNGQDKRKISLTPSFLYFTYVSENMLPCSSWQPSCEHEATQPEGKANGINCRKDRLKKQNKTPKWKTKTASMVTFLIQWIKFLKLRNAIYFLRKPSELDFQTLAVENILRAPGSVLHTKRPMSS